MHTASRSLATRSPRTAPWTVALASALLATAVPVANAQPQDDAGSGADAPDSWASALDVAPGVVHGSLHPDGGDADDWYRLPVVDGDLLEVSVEFGSSNGTWFLEVRRDDGTFVKLIESLWGSIRTTFLAADGVRLGVRVADPAPVSVVGYRLELEPRYRPDMALLSVDVTPLDPSSDEPFTRKVSVTIENQGRGADYGQVFIEVHYASPWSCTDRLGHDAFLLLPGEKATLTAAWDTFGHVGDAELQGEAFAVWDDNPDNDRGSLDVAMLLPLAGKSVAPSCLH